MARTDLADIKEAEFQHIVREYAESRGWLVHMIAISATRTADGKGWRGLGPRGFPDLVCVRSERVVAAELKTETGSTSPEQRKWLSALAATPVEQYLWRPRDAAEIVETLS